MVNLLLEDDPLNVGRIKINEAIKQTNTAIERSTSAEILSSNAENIAQNVQEQLDNIVLKGDSSVEAAQARVNYRGKPFDTLKKRIDDIDIEITERGLSPLWYGAKGDNTSNDTAAFVNTLNSIREGGTIFIPPGYTFLLNTDVIEVLKNGIRFTGGGTIRTKYGFRIKGNDFKADHLKLISSEYTVNTACIHTDMNVPVENIHIQDCNFNGFFYASNFRNARNTSISNCVSYAPPERNAGHFQHVKSSDCNVSGCSTSGGINATSYNFFDTNGYVRVINNHDENNTYGSCEIENATGEVVVTGNTFKKMVWIDDSYDVIVSGNTVDDTVRVSVGSNVGNTSNIIVNDNICTSIRAIGFGDYLGGMIENLTIKGNITRGTAAQAIFVDGKYCRTVLISGNQLTGINSDSRIGVVRGQDLTCIMRENIVNGKIKITGSSGKIYGVNNFGAQHEGDREQFPVSFRDTAWNGMTMMSDGGNRYKVYVGESGQLYTLGY